MKKFAKTLILLALAAPFMKMQATAEKCPEFDYPNSLVVDSAEFKNTISVAIRAVDYAEDRTIECEFYGFGGKFLGLGDKYQKEWTYIGKTTLKGFSDLPFCPFPSGWKIDYTRFQYFALKIVRPTDRTYQITYDDKEGCCNFYIWEEYQDTEMTPLPYFKQNPDGVYVFDGAELGDTYEDYVWVHNKTKDIVPLTLYAYDRKTHVWLVFGTTEVKKYNEKVKLSKSARRYDLDDFRYFAIEVDSEKQYYYNVSAGRDDITIIIQPK